MKWQDIIGFQALVDYVGGGCKEERKVSRDGHKPPVDTN